MVGHRTGYFGRPSGDHGKALSTKVHVIDCSGKTLCGYVPHSTLSFQWCANVIVFSYIECPGCKEKARLILADMYTKKARDIFNKNT